jgi:hypothetical protein
MIKMTYEWRAENKQVFALCTYEGGCECLEEGEPAIEDCVNCPSFEWVEDQNHSKEDLMI